MTACFYRCFLVALILFTVTSLAEARGVRFWTYQELLDKADFVVIAVPTATGDSQEQLQNLSGMAQPVVGVETKFQVSAVLKGEKSKNVGAFPRPLPRCLIRDPTEKPVRRHCR